MNDRTITTKYAQQAIRDRVMPFELIDGLPWIHYDEMEITHQEITYLWEGSPVVKYLGPFSIEPGAKLNIDQMVARMPVAARFMSYDEVDELREKLVRAEHEIARLRKDSQNAKLLAACEAALELDHYTPNERRVKTLLQEAIAAEKARQEDKEELDAWTQ